MSLQMPCQPKLKRPAGLRLILPSHTETMRRGWSTRGPGAGSKSESNGAAVDGRDDWGDCGDSLFGAESLKQA